MISWPATSAISMTAGNQSASCWGLRFVNIGTMIADAVSVPILSPAQWSQIDTVLLDLDGTLLDLAFDRRFWRQRVPEAWAQQRAITLEQSRAELQPRFAAREGTLDWSCIEYWSRELELDIRALKQGVAH